MWVNVSIQTHAASAPGRPDQSQPGAGNFLLNSHDGSSSYQMLPGLFRLFVVTDWSAASRLVKYEYRIRQCGGESD